MSLSFRRHLTITSPMEPEIGTVVNGIGNEIIVLLGVLIMLMVMAMFLKMFLAGYSPQHLHPDTVSAVQSARRVMGVAQEGAEPQVPVETCSVCLDRAQHPVQTNCGHRFCARCMLEYWRHDQWPHPARCPICRTTVTLLLGSELEDRQLRDQVLDYNQRMSGEWRPVLSYLYDVPVLLRHLWEELFSERGPLLIRRLYLGYILLLLVAYLLSPFDLLPESVFGLLGYIDDLMILLIALVYVTFLYRNFIAQRT